MGIQYRQCDACLVHAKEDLFNEKQLKSDIMKKKMFKGYKLPKKVKKKIRP